LNADVDMLNITVVVSDMFDETASDAFVQTIINDELIVATPSRLKQQLKMYGSTLHT